MNMEASMAGEQQQSPYGADTPKIPAESRGKESSEADAVKSIFESLGSDYDEEPAGDEGASGDDEESAGSGDDEGAETDEVEASDEDQDESGEREEHDDSDEDEDRPSPKLHKLKANGKDEEVTYEELVRRASAGTDYTRKTQAVAEKERAADARASELQATQQKYVEGLGRLEEILKDVRGKEPDWDKLRAQDPDEFARQWADWSIRSKDLESVEQRKSEEQRKLDETAAKKRQERIDTEVGALREKWPEFTDEKKGPATFKRVQDYLTENYGFTPQDILGVEDHRLFLLVRDAMFGHEVRTKGKQKLKGKLKEAPKALPPSARRPTSKGSPSRVKKEAEGLRQRLRRSGRSTDAVSYVERLMTDLD